MVTDTNDKVYYIEGEYRFATTSGFLGVFKKNHPWCLTAHISFLKDHRKFWAKRIHDKNCVPCALEVTNSVCSSARMLPDLKKSTLLSAQPSTAHTSASYAYPSGHHPGDTVDGRHPKQPHGMYKTLQIR